VTSHGFTEPSRGLGTDQAADLTDSRAQGPLLRGRYALERLIEDELLARVYIGRDLVLDRILAVTVLQDYVAAKQHLVDRFLEVERRAGAVFHPNLATIFDVGVADGLCWSVHEYCGGGTLRQRLPTRQPIPAWQIVSLLSQIGSALGTLHRYGIVHGRVTPDWIRFDDAGAARLGGAGLAAIAELPGLPSATRKSHLDAYIAPEQRGGATPDAAADQYALALVGAELFAGTWHAAGLASPDPGVEDLLSYLKDIRPDLSSGALTALARALSVDPDRRFLSIDDFLAAFSSTTESAAQPMILMRAGSPGEPATRPIERAPSAVSSAKTRQRNQVTRPHAIPVMRARAAEFSRRAAKSGSAALGRARMLTGQASTSAAAAFSRTRVSGGRAAVQAARQGEEFATRAAAWYRRQHPADRFLLAAGAVALVLVMISVVPLALFPTPSLAAPALEGSSAEAARTLAAEHGLRVAVREESSTAVPAGYVIRQETPAGAMVRSDRAINLVVSSGPPPVPIPNVLRRDIESARRELESAGLTLGAISELDTNRQAWGTIAAQSIRSGRYVPPGTAVDVTVATPPWTDVPKLVDRGIGDVEKELDGRGLKLGEVRLQPQDGLRAGSVLAQDPPVNTRLRQGSLVAVTIAVPYVEGRSSP
jgi:eukaryotic-like serine/threonine-protein kinase